MKFKDKSLDLSLPHIMGILNVTPDSFSDGGQFTNIDTALKQAEQMQHEGAAMIDVGGESTRPGAKAVNAQQELDRVVPVIEKISQNLDVIISIDTSKAEVMCEAIKAGAHMVNDVMALRADNALQTAAELKVPVCLMHMQGEPRTMQESPEYNNVVHDVYSFLKQRIQACLDAGINNEQIIIDPGFGFGKTVAHNMQLIKGLAEFLKLEVPVLLGVSRKSTIGAILDKPVDERLFGSLALASLGLAAGAKIIRAHDVAATNDVLKMVQAVETA